MSPSSLHDSADVNIYVCLCLFLSACMFVCLLLCRIPVSAYLYFFFSSVSFCLYLVFMSASVCLSVCQHVYLSMAFQDLPVRFNLFVSLFSSMFQTVRAKIPVCLPTCLSVCLAFCICLSHSNNLPVCINIFFVSFNL